MIKKKRSKKYYSFLLLLPYPSRFDYSCFFKMYERESKLSLTKPKMEDVILRFPTVAESIFAELDNASLSKCKEVTNLWASFIGMEKLPWIRMILKYSENMVEFFDHWKRTMNRAPVEIVKELALIAEEFYCANSDRKTYQWSPSFIVAYYGNHGNSLKGIANCSWAFRRLNLLVIFNIASVDLDAL